MDQRTILAVALSILVLLFYNSFVVKPISTKPAINSTEHVEDNVVTSNKPTEIFPSAPAPIPQAKVSKVLLVEETQTIENEYVRYNFSSIGGTIKSVFLKKYSYEFPLGKGLDVVGFEEVEYKLTEVNNSKISYTYADPTGITITKTFTILPNSYVLNSEILFLSNDLSKLNNARFVNITIDSSKIDPKSVNDADKSLFEYSVSYESVIFRKAGAHTFSEKDNSQKSFNVNWTGFRDRFFCALVKPLQKTREFSVSAIDKGILQISTTSENVSSPESTGKYGFLMYFGPQKQDLLKSANPDFTKIMVFSNFSVIDVISKFILSIMNYSHKIVPNWGVAIIIISIFVYFSMYPLTLKGMLSMRKMQSLQPRMAQLREQFKNNPQKLNKEIMTLYKDNGVNPLAGCFPFILQMPVFIALYQALWRTVDLKGASFLWIKDLAQPDRFLIFPTQLPVIGNELNILPILMGAVMFLQQKLSSKNMIITDESQVLQQKIMLIFFPLFLGFIFYKFASGLTLYFTLFYLFSAVTQWKMSKIIPVVK